MIRKTYKILLPVTVTLDSFGNVTQATVPPNTAKWVEEAVEVERRQADYAAATRCRMDELLVRLTGRGTFAYKPFERATKHHLIVGGRKYQRATGRPVGAGTWDETDDIHDDDLKALNAMYPPEGKGV